MWRFGMGGGEWKYQVMLVVKAVGHWTIDWLDGRHSFKYHLKFSSFF